MKHIAYLRRFLTQARVLANWTLNRENDSSGIIDSYHIIATRSNGLSVIAELLVTESIYTGSRTWVFVRKVRKHSQGFSQSDYTQKTDVKK